jgi:hypothetical protein
VFTARYALSPYIKQTHFVFKGLINLADILLKCPVFFHMHASLIAFLVYEYENEIMVLNIMPWSDQWVFILSFTRVRKIAKSDC